MTALIEIEIAIVGADIDFNVFPISGSKARLAPFIVSTTLANLEADPGLVKIDVQDAVDNAEAVPDPAAQGPG